MAEPAELPRAVAWARWVLLIGFGFQIVLGHVIAFGLDGPLMAWHQDRVARALWGTADYAGHVAAYRAWIQALVGGTMISYAWAMLWLVAIPLRRREPWAAWAIAIATLHWFAIDTSLSAAHGVAVNVAFNCVALLLVAIPLAIMLPWLRAEP